MTGIVVWGYPNSNPKPPGPESAVYIQPFPVLTDRKRCDILKEVFSTIFTTKDKVSGFSMFFPVLRHKVFT